MLRWMRYLLWMQIYGFDSNDDINEPGREAERVYDDIYIHND